MNIALFASAFHPNVGGVEEVCRQLAHAYRLRGDGVDVWTERWPRSLPAFELYENILVHRFPMRVPADSWQAKLSYALTHRRIRSQVVRAVRAQEADVLHVQCVSSSAWYALWVKQMLKLPLVVTLQGELTMDAAGVFQRPGIGQRIMRTALREADAITACSYQTLHEAERFYGESFGNRGRVIYNGINLQEFEEAQPYRHPRPYILAIGRHVREKGFDVLLRALALADDIKHDLILAGDGLENANLRALTAELGLEAKVHFLGRVDHAKAVQLFKGCSFFVLPSRHEPFGIVNLEAMAAGKAIVASRVGGVPEVVEDERTALLVPGENPQALCRALSRLAGDNSLRTRLGQEGARHVEAFRWNDLADEYRRTYQDTLESTSVLRGKPL